ncbi:hypothetical protein F4801DRAFT_593848 [Xylaria longipes]|nr:hypothetical protein F4801DRAFT_593848 [Xylaria longipes]
MPLWQVFSTLYSHIVRRPLSRALPRIPRRSSTWPCDNTSVGRGASTPLSFIFTDATTAAPASHDTSFLAFRRVEGSNSVEGPRTPLSIISTDATTAAPASHDTLFLAFRRVSTSLRTPETVSSHPTYKILPAAETKAVEPNEPDATLVEGVEPRSPTVTDGETENKVESSDSVEGAAASPPQSAAEDIERIEELHTRDEPQQSFEQAGVSDSETDVLLSRRIHILGFNAHARFIAHAIASTPDVPVNIFVHHRKVLSYWGAEHRKLSLYDGEGSYISSAAIPCPERIFGLSQRLESANIANYFLDNVIVDTAEPAVLPSLNALRDRIDRHTTICLLQPGLGLLEHINEYIFPDPVTRPNFVLGHSTHQVGRVSSSMYSIQQKRRGFLYLHGVPRLEDSARDESSIAYEAMRQSQHLAKLLSSTETLNVVGLPWVRFLSWKLPWLIFCSAADSISVMLGCRYEEIYKNDYARALWEDILDESIAIVSQLPELQEVPHKRGYFTGNAFRRRLRTFLASQRANTSPWIKQVKMGDYPPVDYFNGYIVRRASKLGLNHKHNSMASEAVKARVSARRWELHTDIMSASPYMTDTDIIGGGQPGPTLEEVVELELEDP